MKRYRDRRHIRLYEYDGRSHTLGEWADRTGIAYETLRHRLKAGLTLKQALTRPVSHGSNGVGLTFDGQTLKISEWAKKLGLRSDTIRARLRVGMPIEVALSGGTLPHAHKGKVMSKFIDKPCLPDQDGEQHNGGKVVTFTAGLSVEDALSLMHHAQLNGFTINVSVNVTSCNALNVV